MLTPDQLAEIKARVEAVPKGPWVIEGDYPQRITNAEALVIAECFTVPQWPPSIAEFITHARTDVPVLVAEVKQQTKRANTAEGQRSAYSDAMHQIVGVIGELQAMITLARAEDLDLNAAKQLDYLDRLVNGKAVPAAQVPKRDLTPSERRRLTTEIEKLTAERDAAQQRLGYLAGLARTADHETAEAYTLHDSVTDLIKACKDAPAPTSSRTTCRHCKQVILRRSADGVWFSKAETGPVTSDCNDSPDSVHAPVGGEGQC